MFVTAPFRLQVFLHSHKSLGQAELIRQVVGKGGPIGQL